MIFICLNISQQFSSNFSRYFSRRVVYGACSAGILESDRFSCVDVCVNKRKAGVSEGGRGSAEKGAVTVQ
jgi:hypothetical protein